MTDLELAAQRVAGGGVVLLPTETVYGLSGDARRPDVAARIHQIKGSDPMKPLLALTDSWARVRAWVQVSSQVQRLWAASDIGPLTLVLPTTDAAPPALTSDEGLIGIRQTTSSFALEVVARLGAPIFSTSANASGASPPARFEDVDPSILRAVDVAVNAGRALAGAPSTVARFDTTSGVFEILREGPVSADMLAAAVRA